MPLVSLEARSASTLQRQLRDGLRALILHGPIVRGVRLPSSRTLALKLGVSRNTVLFAYEELATEQLVTGQIGSGTQSRPTQHLRASPLPTARRFMSSELPATLRAGRVVPFLVIVADQPVGPA